MKAWGYESHQVPRRYEYIERDIMKTYRVMMMFDKQETYFVKANSKEEAEEKAHHGEGYSEVHDSTDWSGYIETTVESEEDNEEI